MALVIVFMLGVVNFALHRAVLDCRHPVLGHVPWQENRLGGWVSLSVEFVMLLISMAMIDHGSVGWAWGYAGYTLANVVGAWALLRGHI
jgi:hypothetical protein